MIAKFIQDLLNTTDLEFRITDERQEFDTYKKNDKYIAGIVVQLLSNYLYDEVGNRVTSFQIEFEGKNKDFTAFKEVLETFPNNETFDDIVIYSQKPVFDEFVETGGSKKFKARLGFQFVEVIGAESGKTTRIKVDDVEIPITEILFRKDKSIVNNVTYGDNNDVKLINEVLTITIPVVNTLKVKELLLDVLDDSYNKKYTIEWTIGGIVKTASFTSRGGFLNPKNTPEPMTFSIILERALPRKKFQVAVYEEESHWFTEETSEIKDYDGIIPQGFPTYEDWENYFSTKPLEEEGKRYRYLKNGPQVWGEVLNETPTMDAELYTPAYADTTSIDETMSSGGITYPAVTDVATLMQRINAGVLGSMHFREGLYRFQIRNPILRWEFEMTTPTNEQGGGSEYSASAYTGDPFDEETFMEYINDNYDVNEFVIRYDFLGNPIHFRRNQRIVIVDTEGDIKWWARAVSISWMYFFIPLYEANPTFYYATAVVGGKYGAYKSIPAIEYGFNVDQDAETIAKGLNVKAILTTFTRGFKAIIISGNKDIADDAILIERKKYKIKFEYSGNEYEIEGLQIQSAGLPVSEHADLILEVTWVEGA